MPEVILQRSIYNNDHKPRRKRPSDEMPAPSGPSSASPGAWLTAIIVDALIPDELAARKEPDPETRDKKLSKIVPKTLGEVTRYEGAVEILRAYYPLGPRYRTRKFPLNVIHGQPGEIEPPATEFWEEPESLETKSLVFGSAPWPLMDDSPNFPMVNQPNVLCGTPLLAYYQTRAQELAEYRAWKAEQPDEEGEEGEGEDEEGEGEEADGILFPTIRDGRLDKLETESTEDDEERPSRDTTGAKFPRYKACSDNRLISAYATWDENPNSVTRSDLFEAFHDYLSKNSKLAAKGDLLRHEGLAEDFQQDFILGMLQFLDKKQQQGQKIQKIVHYLNRAWKFSRRKANKIEDKRIRRTERFGVGENEREYDEPLSSPFDNADRADWALVDKDKLHTSEDEERLRQRRLDLIPTLPPQLADVAGLHLQGKNQREIGLIRGISQQAVSRQLVRIAAFLQAAEVL